MIDWIDVIEWWKQYFAHYFTKKDKKRMLNEESLFEQLKIDEGVVYEIYLDHLGHPTFGVGHLVKKSDPEWEQPVGTPVSEERVWECFLEDVRKSIDDCYAVFGKRIFNFFPGEVQEVLVNMMFNLGRTRFSKFKKMIAALNHHNYAEAAKEGRDSVWYKQVTNRAERLMTKMENIA